MKKFTLTLTGVCCVAIFAFGQTATVTIDGNITNSVNGYPISNHLVYIASDSIMAQSFSYYDSVYTNTSGNYYTGSIFVPVGTNGAFILTTYDCNSIANIDSILPQIIDTSQKTFTSNFSICDSATTFLCQAGFYYYPDTTINSLIYYFNDISIVNPTSWYWDFGDGDTATSQNTMHNYAVPGSYFVCLTIQNDTGCISTYCDSLIVDSFIPNCWGDLSFSYSITNLTVSFLGNSTNPNVNYNWDFGDGAFANNIQNPTHTYSSIGVYTICLSTSDSSGCSEIYCNAMSLTNQFNIYGVIVLSFDSADVSTVYLIEYDSMMNTLTAIDTTNVIGPYYSFLGAYTGSYLIKAALDSPSVYYTDYLPTYYGDALFWDSATFVQLGSDTFITINLIQGNNPGGPGFIGGNVTQGANKVGGPGDPIAGIEVLLLDTNDNPIAYTYSDTTGYFAFNNIAYDTYKVYAEVTGKYTNPGIVTIDSVNPSVTNVQVEVNNTNVTTSIGNSTLETFSNIITIYPNPSNGEFILSTRKTGLGSVYIYNVLGKIIYQKENLTGPKLIVDISNQSKGVYFVKITSEESVSINKIIIY